MVDFAVAFDQDNFFQMLSASLGALTIIGVVSYPLLTGPVVLCVGLYLGLMAVSERCVREIKRLANNAASPVLGHLVEHAPPVHACTCASAHVYGMCMARACTQVLGHLVEVRSGGPLIRTLIAS